MASDLLSGSGGKKESTYDASSIEVLEDMEHVRLLDG
jgi:topoisomerase-4 subunit B